MTRHPGWCAGGHRCNHAEHRADPITIRIPGAGSAVLTRVGDDRGQHAEVRLSVALPTGDRDARAQIATLLLHLETLLTVMGDLARYRARLAATGRAALPWQVTR